MENLEQRLTSILVALEKLPIVISDTKHVHQKHMLYQQGLQYLAEANKILDSLQREVSNVKFDSEKLSYKLLNDLLLLVNSAQLKWDEIVYIIKQLKIAETSVPTTAKITDNLDKEVIYVERENDDFY